MGAEPSVASLPLADVVTVMRVLLRDEPNLTGATSALPSLHPESGAGLSSPWRFRK